MCAYDTTENALIGWRRASGPPSAGESSTACSRWRAAQRDRREERREVRDPASRPTGCDDFEPSPIAHRRLRGRTLCWQWISQTSLSDPRAIAPPA